MTVIARFLPPQHQLFKKASREMLVILLNDAFLTTAGLVFQAVEWRRLTSI